MGYDILGRPETDLVRDTGRRLWRAAKGYAYNDSGDLIGVSGFIGSVRADAAHTYDYQHRLLTASGPTGYEGSFSYSPAGSVETALVSQSGSPISRDVRYEYGAVDPQAVDRLVDHRTGGLFAGFEYDPAGNMTVRETSSGTWTFDWDGDDQMREANGPDGAEAYCYDPDGARTLAVTSKGVRFWFGNSETHFDAAGRQTRRRIHITDGAQAVGRVENGTEIDLCYSDALHNLMLSLDRGARPVASFLYGAFGETVHSTGENGHRRRFNGKENDILTGLRYYGYRYYGPLALRWTAADPPYRFAPDLGAAEPRLMNVYSFSLNNPLRYYDPDGRKPITAADGVKVVQQARALKTWSENKVDANGNQPLSYKGTYKTSGATGKYGNGTWKCNLLVGDSFHKAGVGKGVARHKGKTNGKKWTHYASAGKIPEKNFDVVTDRSTIRKGDVIVKDSTSEFPGHVEIVTDVTKDESGKVTGFKTIGARDAGVKEDNTYGKRLAGSGDWDDKSKEDIKVTSGGSTRTWKVLRPQAQ